MQKRKSTKTVGTPSPSPNGRNRSDKSQHTGERSGGRTTRPPQNERTLRNGFGIVDIQGIKTTQPHERVSLAFGKDEVYGSLKKMYAYMAHIQKVCANVTPGYKEIEFNEEVRPVEVVRHMNTLIKKQEERLIQGGEGIGLYYDSNRARWEFLVRDAKFDGDARIFDCSFLEYLRIADLHLYDIMAATLSHVWHKAGIPLWEDHLDHILEMLENYEDFSDAPEDENEEGQVVGYQSSVDYFRSGPPAYCVRVIHNAYKRLPWNKLNRVIEAYNWNTPQKVKILEWVRESERMCKTLKHTFMYFDADRILSDSEYGKYVPTHELYGMYWDDGGVVDYQFNEYMNNQMGNFEPIPMTYRVSAETKLTKFTADPDVRTIDNWFLTSCYLMDYKFMIRYFNGARKFKAWKKEVYDPAIEPKPLLTDILFPKNVY